MQLESAASDSVDRRVPSESLPARSSTLTITRMTDFLIVLNVRRPILSRKVEVLVVPAIPRSAGATGRYRAIAAITAR